jgi:hypothetical protein
LEQKYQDAVQMLDKAELKKDRAVFECDMAKKEKAKYVELYQQLQAELAQARARCAEIDQERHDLQHRLAQAQQEVQRAGQASAQSA